MSPANADEEDVGLECLECLESLSLDDHAEIIIRAMKKYLFLRIPILKAKNEAASEIVEAQSETFFKLANEYSVMLKNRFTKSNELHRKMKTLAIDIIRKVRTELLTRENRYDSDREGCLVLSFF